VIELCELAVGWGMAGGHVWHLRPDGDLVVRRQALLGQHRSQVEQLRDGRGLGHAGCRGLRAHAP